MPFDFEHEDEGGGEGDHARTYKAGIKSGVDSLKLTWELIDGCRVCFTVGFIVGAIIFLLSKKNQQGYKDETDEEFVDSIAKAALRLYASLDKKEGHH